MIPVGTAVGFLTLNHTQFSANLKTAINEATLMSGKLSNTLGQGLKTVGDTMANTGRTLTYGLTLPLGLAAANTVKFGAEFDKKMSEVQAVSNATVDEFEAMRDAAISWGEKTVYTATEAGDALYYMGLAGWEPQKSIAALGSVLSLAAAGNLELGRTSDIVTDVMTALGVTAGEYTKGVENTTYFTNRLAAAMSNSNTDVDQLGEAFKYVAPLAGAAGMSIDDLTIALGMMANVGVKGSQAGTGLRQALKNLINPTDEAALVMDKFNVSLFNPEDGSAKDMLTFMNELRTSFGSLSLDLYDAEGALKSGEQIMEEYANSLPITEQEKLNAIVEIFGVRALPGILGIINQPIDRFSDLKDAVYGSDEAFVMHNGTIYTMQDALKMFGEEAVRSGEGFEILGAAQGMALMQMDNLQGDWIRFTSALGTTRILLTDLVKGSLRLFVQRLTELVQKFNSLDDEQKKNILKWVGIAAAVGPALFAFGKVVSGVGNMIIGFQKMSEAFNLIKTGAILVGTKIKNVGEAFKLAKAGLTGFAGQTSSLGTALAGITAPMAAIAALVAVLVAAFVHLWKTNEEFRNKIIAIWDGIKAKFEAATGKIKDAINSLGFDFESLGVAIKAAWDWLCTALAPILVEIFANVGRYISSVIDIITGVVQVICGIIKGFKDGDWTLFIEGIKSIWNGFWTMITSPFVAVFNVITEYLNMFGLTWSDVWTGISNFFINLWNGIKTFFINTWNSITAFINGVLTGISTFITNTWNAIKTFVSNTLTAIWTTIQNIWTAIKTFVTTTVENIKTGITTRFEQMKTAVTTTIENVRTTLNNIWNAISTFVVNTVENIKTSVSSKFTQLKSSIQSTVTAMKTKVESTIENMKQNIINKAKAIYTGIVNVFSTIKKKMEEVGTNIVNGLWEGISKGWEWLKTKVSNLASSLVKTTENALGIKSPSTVFRDRVGLWIPPGIVEGFVDAMPKAMADMKNALNKGLDGFEHKDIDVVGLGVSFSTIVDDIADWFESIEERLATTVENIKSDIAEMVELGNTILDTGNNSIIPGFNMLQNKPSDSLVVNDPNGMSSRDGGSGNNVTNITFYSNEAIDEIQAAKLLKETQRDLAEGFVLA